MVISIHAPREGCDVRMRLGEWRDFISIHAPREGCDKADESLLLPTPRNFNPRTP